MKKYLILFILLAWASSVQAGGLFLVAGGSGTPPTTPVISATAGDTQVTIALDSGDVGALTNTLYWDTTSRASYNLYANNISNATLVAASFPGTPYVHGSLTNGTPYYYRLCGTDLAGQTCSSESTATPAAAGSGIAYGNVTTGSGAFVAGAASLTAPAVSGSNTVMVLCISINASDSYSLAASYNSSPLGSPTFSGESVYTRLYGWIVVNPASAADFAFTSDYGVAKYAMQASYYTGVNQSSPRRTGGTYTATGDGTSATIGITDSQTNDLIVGCFGLDDTALADGLTQARMGAGQTFRSTVTNSTDEASIALCEEPGASGTVTHSWGFVDDGVNSWAVIAIPLIPAN